ncbi:MAG: dihydrofolate reductase [Firmicutes bacterium]|jgi:dihydrofolate reductase|nr:dihydrofolate reductase [Bacillota bacterium]
MKLIAVADKNWGIGKDNKLLCHLPGDLKYFKEKTLGKTIVMGRKTLESLPGGKPLPGRKTIILTRDKTLVNDGVQIIHSIEELLSINDEELIVAGGGQIYNQLLEYCDSCLITKLDCSFDADTFLSDLDTSVDFEMIWQSEEQVENGISYRFTEYKRI